MVIFALRYKNQIKMKASLFTIGALSLLFLAGCAGGRYMEMTNAGEAAYLYGDFHRALDNTEQIIAEAEGKGRQAPGKTYTVAGMAAFELEEYDKSLQYLLKAQEQEYSDEQLYLYLARNYRILDNLSKEISALEAYQDKYPEGTDIKAVRERLFQTCLESEDFSLAEELWTGLDSTARENITSLQIYLQLNRLQEKDRVCDSLAGRILARDAGNEHALSWFAESFYWKAENTYLYQMKAYKENRTHKQYAILLEAFKQVNADFRKSRDYFLKLYSRYPKPEYAGYLANIYTRLEDEEKAAYYRKRAD